MVIKTLIELVVFWEIVVRDLIRVLVGRSLDHGEREGERGSLGASGTMNGSENGVGKIGEFGRVD